MKDSEMLYLSSIYFAGLSFIIQDTSLRVGAVILALVGMLLSINMRKDKK